MPGVCRDLGHPLVPAAPVPREEKVSGDIFLLL
jgi:hypothetical protein